MDVLVQGSELAAALDEDRIQLAIVDENCARGFQWTPLTDAPLVAVTPPDFPWTGETISLARLMQEPFLSCPEQYVEQYLPADTPRLEVAASDDGAILSMVAGGLGVSVLSAYSLAGYENQVRVIPLDQPLSRRLGVAVKAMPAANSPARSCAQKAGKKCNLDAGALFALRHICLVEDKKIFGFRISVGSLAKLSTAAEQYALTHLDKPLKSYDFLRSVLP